MRCQHHPAYEADNCPSCGTSRPVGMTTEEILATTPEPTEADRRRHDLVVAALRPHEADAAVAAYVALVRAIGPGFHPDTDGADYASLPAGYTPADVDRIVEAATDHADVYVVALDVLDGGDGTGPDLDPVADVWADLATIADALGAHVDPHGLIDVEAAGDRVVLVDHEEAFRVGLYERDHDRALVMIETPTVGYAIEAARVLSRPGIEVTR